MNNFISLHSLCFVFLFIAFTPLGFAAPANDHLANATLIDTLPFNQQQNTAGANNETSEVLPTCLNNGQASVWYQYTATSEQTVVFNTFGSDYDTALSVWNGNSHPLTPISCNDDSSNVKQSQVQVALQAGTTYYINVSGYQRETGTLNLTALEVKPLANDNLANAIVITPDANNTYSYTQTTQGATQEENEDISLCNINSQRSVWYQYTPSEDQRPVFDTVGSDYNTVLSIWSGAGYPLEEILCNDNNNGPQSQLRVSLTAGETYYLKVAVVPSNSGGSLVEESGLLVLNMSMPPDNDLLANAIQIEEPFPYTNTQNTAGATMEFVEMFPTCTLNANSSVWYLFVPTTDYSNVSFSTFGSGYDTVLSIWEGDDHPLTELACNDNASLIGVEQSNASQITIPLNENLTYYIDVGGVDNAAGKLTLRVEEGELDFKIISQPAGKTIASCQTATLTADVGNQSNGEPIDMTVNPIGSQWETNIALPFVYKWYQGNSGDDTMLVAEIKNDTVFTTPQLIENMNYWVRITNPTGTIDSETAIVTVDKNSGNCEDIATINDDDETDNNGSDTPQLSDTNGVGIDVNGSPVSTTAHFVGRVTKSLEEQKHLSIVKQADKIFAAFTITVDPNHVDEIAEILMVGGYTQNLITNFYMRDVSDWTLWDVNMVNLEEAEVYNLLPENLYVSVFEGSLDGLPGNFAVYVGYRLTNGSIFYIAEPITFTVK